MQASALLAFAPTKVAKTVDLAVSGSGAVPRVCGVPCLCGLCGPEAAGLQVFGQG